MMGFLVIASLSVGLWLLIAATTYTIVVWTVTQYAGVHLTPAPTVTSRGDHDA